MLLESSQTDRQIRGDGFIVDAFDHLLQYFPLTVRKRSHQLMETATFNRLQAPLLIDCECVADGFEEHLGIGRLFDEIEGARFQSLQHHRNIAVPRK